MMLKKLLAACSLLMASAFATAAGPSVAALAPAPASSPTFPVRMVGVQVDGYDGVAMRFYSPTPGMSFCVVYAGKDLNLGPSWKHTQQCLVTDKYGFAAVHASANGNGLLIVSTVLVNNEVHTDVLDLGALRSQRKGSEK
jgi:hypothetical protein